MKAFILAAGLGTRLGGLTADKPKALVEVAGKPMLENLILHLRKQGIREILVNVHHFGEQVIEFLQKMNFPEVNIRISDERDRLLDTGGALAKAAWFFRGDEPVLVHNVDVISSVDLQQLQNTHSQTGALATLCVRQRDSSRGLLFDNSMQLVGWVGPGKDNFKWVNGPVKEVRRLAFSGIYLASPGFADALPAEDRFSVVDAWLHLAKTRKITGFEDRSEFWFDLGTPEKIREAETFLAQREKQL